MKTRFIKSVVETAKATDVDMPWSRSARAAKRDAEQEVRKSA